MTSFSYFQPSLVFYQISILQNGLFNCVDTLKSPNVARSLVVSDLRSETKLCEAGGNGAEELKK